MHLIKAYLRFLLRATNQHGVHSPFVYHLVTRCFYDKKPRAAYELLKNYREALLRNHDIISVTDFGAGSRVFQSNERKISAIAKNAGISPKRARLLHRLVSYFKPENVLELGTSLGLATSALASGHPSAQITTLEGCAQTAGVAKKQLEAFGLTQVKFALGEFEKTLAALEVPHRKFDLIYFDGNHQKDATLRYFETLLPTAHNDSVWVFDDIHWSPGMEAAWEAIKAHERVTVTVDTFQWGLVFFRKEQEKQHFSIRA